MRSRSYAKSKDKDHISGKNWNNLIGQFLHRNLEIRMQQISNCYFIGGQTEFLWLFVILHSEITCERIKTKVIEKFLHIYTNVNTPLTATKIERNTAFSALDKASAKHLLYYIGMYIRNNRITKALCTCGNRFKRLVIMNITNTYIFRHIQKIISRLSEDIVIISSKYHDLSQYLHYRRESVIICGYRNADDRCYTISLTS